jgi:hypothetical protein
LWVRSLIGYVVASYVVCGFMFLRGAAPHGNDGIFVIVWLLSPALPLVALHQLWGATLRDVLELSWVLAAFVGLWLTVQVTLLLWRRAPAKREGIA